jgi:predicted nucleotidyltransferase
MAHSDLEARKLRIIQQMQDTLTETGLWNTVVWGIHVFGSAANGFGDVDADIDLTLEGSGTAVQSLEVIRLALQYGGFEVIELVAKARIPILKLRLEDTECDVSYNNTVPLYNTRLLLAYAHLSDGCVNLVQHLKHWAKARGLHSAHQGHLSSYAWTLLGIYYLQVRHGLPGLQCDAKPAFVTVDGRSLNIAFDDHKMYTYENPCADNEVFAGFFRFFTLEFIWGEEVVSVRTGQRRHHGAFPTLAKRYGPDDAEVKLFIEDPIECHRDLSTSFWPSHCAMLQKAVHQSHAELCAILPQSVPPSRPSKLTLAEGRNPEIDNTEPVRLHRLSLEEHLSLQPHVSSAGDVVAPASEQNTTVVVMNLDRKANSGQLLQWLAEQFDIVGGRDIDFVYMPLDLKSACSKGYAIVNIRSADLARDVVAKDVSLTEYIHFRKATIKWASTRGFMANASRFVKRHGHLLNKTLWPLVWKQPFPSEPKPLCAQDLHI